jgi:hypothetical protein
MTDNEIDFSAYAGRVAFPRNPQDLLSTTNCPACFAVLKTTVCSACGLDLNHPAAAELYDASLATAGALDRRLAIIGRMRYETEEAANLRWAAGQEAARGAVAMPAAVGAPRVPEISTLREPQGGPSSIRDSGVSTLRGPQGGPSSTGDGVSTSSTGDNTGDSTGDIANSTGGNGVSTSSTGDIAGSIGDRVGSTTTEVRQRRSSVQVTLLIVGVSLLSVAAIFFLVYAFINFGIVWRSVIIGAITVAAFVVATLLRRRRLTATAEGISAFGVVLIYLDAYAVRANNLFDAASADGTAYWGTTLIVAAIAFIAWHRMSALRIPNVVGFATFAPGVGVLVAGLTQQLAAGTQSFLVFASIAAAGLIHRLAVRPHTAAILERSIVLGTTVLALVGGLFTSLWIYPDSAWAPTFGVAALAIVAAAHVGILLWSDGPFDRAFTYILSGYAGLAAASAVAASALRMDDPNFLLVAPVTAAVAAALALELLARRAPGGAPRTGGMVAASAAAIAASIAALPSLLGSVWWATSSAATGLLRTWDLAPTDATPPEYAGGGWPLLALLLVGALAALAWTVGGLLRTRGPLLLWWAALVVVVAVPNLRTQWLEFGAWLLVAVACLAALFALRGRLRNYRTILVTTLAVSGFLGYLLGWASSSTWWVGTLVVLGFLIASRALVTSAAARASLLCAATALTVLSVGPVAAQATIGANTPPQVEFADRIVLTSVVTVAVLLLSALRTRLLSDTDRRTVFWIAGVAAGLSLVGSTTLVPKLSSALLGSLLLPEFATSLVVAALLLAALALWVALPSNRALRPERIAASIAVGPALYLLVTSFVRVLGLPGFVGTVAPITAALLAAAGALTITTLRPSTTPRWARELSVAIVAIPAVFSSTLTNDGLAWLVLLIAAVTTLLLAIDSDGLFSSASPRRQLGWLALALATVGLWWRLSGDRVTDLAPYVVPLALALIVIASLIGRAANRATPARESRVAPLVTLAGLLVAILPLGVNAATGPLGEAGLLFVISAILLIVGSIIVGTPKWQWNADACAVAGAIGVIVIAVGRASFLPVENLERDGWLAAAFLALLVAAFLQARQHANGNEQVRSTASQWLGLVAMTAVLALEVVALRVEPTGAIRALAVVLLFTALHVVAYFADRAPLTRMLAWVAIVYAAIAAVAGVALDAIHPAEIVTIPIALALLVTGASHLAAVPAARSWPWLAPGTAMLLLPSLLATIDERPVWRIVGLGVVGIAVIVIAVTRRLQAPFVIGVVVVLWHGIATFLPQLRAAYEFFPWWLWLGVGGVLLIVLAARYEQRIRNLRSVAMRFAALR